MKRSIPMAISAVVALQCYAEDVQVDVNVDVKHSVGGISTFDRSKFITIHADIGKKEWLSDHLDNNGNDVSGIGKGKMFTDNFFTEFLEGNDVYLGRSTGGIKWILNGVVKEDLAEAGDPAGYVSRPGFAKPSHMQSEGLKSRNSFKNDSANDAARALRSRHKNWILGNQHHPIWPDGTLTNKGWALSTTNTAEEPLGTAAGEFCGRYINEFFSTSNEEQPPPQYFEVINEPLWELINVPDTPESEHAEIITKLSTFHNTVADQVRLFNVNNPGVKVGGYTTTFPDFEKDNFRRWSLRWKSFIDQTGDNMDFWSIHLYDFPVLGKKEQYRRGSNMEATMDMMQHYSRIALDKSVPLVISEYGAQTHNYNNSPWNPYCDWLQIKGMSAMMMSFMERPHEVDFALPFLVLKAEWGRKSDTVPYKPRLLCQRYERDGLTGDATHDYTWVYSDIIKFYQLWSDVNGTRVDSKSYDLDVMTDAYVDGKKLYLIASNLDFESKTMHLNTSGHDGNKVQQVKIKHLYLDESQAVLEDRETVLDEITYTADIPDSVELRKEGTMVIEYTFADNVAVDHSSNENRYYAETYYKPIVAGQAESFAIKDVTVGSSGEAVLRIGIGRDHGQTAIPKVVFNGTELTVPNNFRGEPQYDRDRFFGVIEIPVPYNLLGVNNTATVEFIESGGHISSVVLQSFEFSKAIRTANGAPVEPQEHTLIEDGRYIHFSADAGVETDNSGAVTQLRNLAADDYYVPSGSGKPVLTVRSEDNLPVLRFNGNTFIKLDNDEKFNAGSTIFAVFNRDSTHTDGVANQRIFSSAFDGSADDWRNNGVNISTNADTGEITRTVYSKSVSISSFKNANVGVYAGGDNSQYLKGDLSEFILYDRQLTSAETAQVEDYLKSKWFTYTVSFDEGDHGSIASADKSQDLFHNDTPVAPAVTPDTGWEHTGWNVAIEPATADVTYRAVYTRKSYTVTFNAGDLGQIIAGDETQTIEHGSGAVAPTIEPIDSYTTHTGWNNTFNSVTGNISVTAEYSFAVPDTEKPPAAADLYLWLDAGKRVLSSAGDVTEWMNLVGGNDYLVADGGQAPQLITRADGKPVVRFDGASYFQYDTTVADGPVTVFAVFNRDSGQVTTNNWQRIFSSYDSVNGADNGAFGIPLGSGTDAGEMGRTIYTRSGSTLSLDNIAIGVNSTSETNQFLFGDISEILVYKSDSVDIVAVDEYLKSKWFSYTISFSGGDHGIIDVSNAVQSVAYKAMPTIPGVIAEVGWNHVGWSTAVSAATADVTYTAVYEQDLVSQKLTLKQGYNFISLSVLPELNQTVDNVLSSIETEVVFVKNKEGLISSFDGADWDNGIGDFIASEGYLLKLKNPVQLTVAGKPATITGPVSLEKGKHLLPAVRDAAALTYFDSIINEIDYIRDDEGNTVRKVNGVWIYGFTHVEAGKAYIVYLNATGLFSP